MKCIDCSKWSPKDAREMAKFGYGLCAHQPKWHFISAESSCERIVAAPAPTVAARKRYLEKLSPRPQSTGSNSKPTEPPAIVSRETTPAGGPTTAPKDSTGRPAFSSQEGG